MYALLCNMQIIEIIILRGKEYCADTIHVNFRPQGVLMGIPGDLILSIKISLSIVFSSQSNRPRPCLALRQLASPTG